MMFKNVYTMVFFVRTPRRINFQSEDGCNNSLWKVGNNVPICTVSHSWRLLSKFLWLQKPQIPFNDYNEQVLPPNKDGNGNYKTWYMFLYFQSNVA
jgi:hypothetical protein